MVYSTCAPATFGRRFVSDANVSRRDLCFPCFRSYSLFFWMPVSSVLLFLAMFWSQSIVVRCQCFTWNCVFPVVLVPMFFFFAPPFSSAVCFPFFRSHSFFLDDPFFLDLFAFHFFFPVHFWKMTVFHLELFASRFFSVPFILPRCHRFFLDIYLLPMFSSQSIAAR